MIVFSPGITVSRDESTSGVIETKLIRRGRLVNRSVGVYRCQVVFWTSVSSVQPKYVKVL